MLYDMLAGGVMVTDRSGHNVVVNGKEGGGGGMAVLGYIAVAPVKLVPLIGPTHSMNRLWAHLIMTCS